MEYKIGDKVRIVKRTRPEDDYPFGFMDDMALLTGQVFTIKEIKKTNVDCSINGDYQFYRLTNNMWNWHSSMFKLVESSELKVGDTVRVISKGFDERNKYLTSTMRCYIGKTFKITQVFEHVDGNSCFLDGSAAGWYWPNCTLEKVFDDDTIEVDSKIGEILREASSDDSELIQIPDCEISASIYPDSIKIIL